MRAPSRPAAMASSWRPSSSALEARQCQHELPDELSRHTATVLERARASKIDPAREHAASLVASGTVLCR
jgi:hypothetical protein